MRKVGYIKQSLLLSLTLTCLVGAIPRMIIASPLDEEAGAKAPLEKKIVELGFNLLDVHGARPAKFFQGQDIPRGFVLSGLRWEQAGKDSKDYLQIDAPRLFRTDENISARFGLKGLVKGRIRWNRVPWIHGDGARTLLSGVGSDVQRQSELAQKLLQDPDGDGIIGSEADNGLVARLVRDLFSATTPFSLDSRRRTGSASLSFAPAAHWTIDLSFSDEKREGVRALGSGTYDRLTFTPDSGTGLDEIFYARGAELVRPIDFSTRIMNLGTSFSQKRWFANARLEWSKFENGFQSLTYSNPLWYTDTYAKSSSTAPPGIFRGWSRGLWNEGRFALEPGNEGFSFDLSGGLILPRSSRLTVSFVRGAVKQNEPFLPYTSNTALNGQVDLNKDGSVDSRDTGTDVSTLPQQGLNGEAVSTSFTLSFTTRPLKALQINLRVPYFKYENKHGRLSFPFRVEYVESNWNPGIQSIQPVFTELTDYSTRGFFVEGIIRPMRILSIRLFGETRHREYAEREVKSTGQNTFGVGLNLAPVDWLDGRFTFVRSNRKFEGAYAPKYTGEQQALRMFDLARVRRDALTADLSVQAGRRLHMGGNVRFFRDNYPESTFGLQETKTAGFAVDLSFQASDRTTLFAYADLERYNFNGRGDTKMGTFNRPGNDWFFRIADKTISAGGGLNAEIVAERLTLDLTGYWVDGNVASSNRNGSGVPYSPLAAGAVSFPDQESKVGGLRLRLVHKINNRLSAGITYWHERFRLSDFAWDNMKPYGYEFLTVDNALRYLFLDSRYGSYSVNVGQLFLRFGF